MPEYGFSLIRISPYKVRIYVLPLNRNIPVRENLYCSISYAVLVHDLLYEILIVNNKQKQLYLMTSTISLLGVTTSPIIRHMKILRNIF